MLHVFSPVYSGIVSVFPDFCDLEVTGQLLFRKSLHLCLITVNVPFFTKLSSLFVSIWSPNFLFYSICCNPFLSFILMHKWPLIGPVWIPSSDSHVFFTCPQQSLVTSSLSATRYSRLILHFPPHWNQSFLQEVLIPFSGKWCLEAKM